MESQGSVQVALRLPASLVAAVEEQARLESRPRAAMLRLCVVEGLNGRRSDAGLGLLEEPVLVRRVVGEVMGVKVVADQAVPEGQIRVEPDPDARLTAQVVERARDAALATPYRAGPVVVPPERLGQQPHSYRPHPRIAATCQEPGCGKNPSNPVHRVKP